MTMPILRGAVGMMNTDEMKAGRELDALVAEKVMGWQWIQSRWKDRTIVYRGLCSPDDLAEFPNVPRATMAEPISPAMTIDDGGLFLPYFSTDISAAWKVWTALLDKTFRKAEWMWRFFSDGGVCIECFTGDAAYMWELESGCGDWSVEGPMPLAICRAALRWKME